jgi:DNA replication protein DnaC
MRLQKRYENVALLIVEKLRFALFELSENEPLFNLIAKRYEYRVTIIPTNLVFGEWVKVLSTRS